MSKDEYIRQRYIELKEDLDPEIAYFQAAVEWFNKKLNEAKEQKQEASTLLV